MKTKHILTFLAIGAEKGTGSFSDKNNGAEPLIPRTDIAEAEIMNQLRIMRNKYK